MSNQEPEYQAQRHAGRRASDTNPPAQGELSTWDKTKDVLLVGFMGLLVLGIIQVLSDLASLRKSITDVRVDVGVYQANETAVEKRVVTLENWAIRHDQEDKAKFQALTRGR